MIANSVSPSSIGGRNVAKTSATQRSLKYLRDNGWSCHIVEKYIKFPNMPFGKRIDAFGIGDILACRPPQWKLVDYKPMVVRPGEIALVQCFPDTGGTGFADHRAKILAIPEAEIWIRAGGKIFLQGWRRGGPRGAVKRWQMKQEEVVLA